MTAHEAGRQNEGTEPLGYALEGAHPRAEATPLIFFIPGLGGEDAPELERFWEPFQDKLQMVSLSYLDWTELAKPDADFTTLVAHIKRQIELKAGNGPVRIAGYSLGGPLAYACALAFQNEGRPVLRLAILDAPANFETLALPLRTKINDRLEKLLAFDMRAGTASVAAKFLTLNRSRDLLLRLSPYRNAPLPLNFGKYLHRKITMQILLRKFTPWWRTMGRPAPQLLAPTYLFRAEELNHFKREDLGWSDYCVNLSVLRVAGSHHTMLDPDKSGPLRTAFVEAMAVTAT